MSYTYTLPTSFFFSRSISLVRGWISTPPTHPRQSDLLACTHSPLAVGILGEWKSRPGSGGLVVWVPVTINGFPVQDLYGVHVYRASLVGCQRNRAGWWWFQSQEGVYVYLTVKANMMASGDSRETCSVLSRCCRCRCCIVKCSGKSRSIEVSPMRNYCGLVESVYYTLFRNGIEGYCPSETDGVLAQLA